MEIVTRWFYDDDAKILCKKQGVITDKGEFEYGNNAYDFSIEKGYHFATRNEAILDALEYELSMLELYLAGIFKKVR